MAWPPTQGGRPSHCGATVSGSSRLALTTAPEVKHKAGRPTPHPRLPAGAEYLLEAERWSVDRAGQLSGRPALPPALHPGAKASTGPGSGLPEAAGAETGGAKGANAANGLPNVDVIVLGPLRYSHSVPHGSSLTVTGGWSSELSASLFSDLRGNFQRNIK